MGFDDKKALSFHLTLCSWWQLLHFLFFFLIGLKEVW